MDSTVEGLRSAAFDLFRAAREAGEYQVAYHALCCALHAAEALEDPETCSEVEARAIECRDWIDAHEPGHKISTRSAKSRGHESVFRQLAVMADAARLRIESQKKQGRPKAPLARS